MVRETRHLWIGNLPENVREEQIRDLFQRHGRVQSVKLLSEDSSASTGGSLSGGNGGVRTGKSATVAFIDIRSASKALRAVHSMAGQPLDINYHEPGSLPPRCHPPADSHPSTETPSDIPVVIGQGSTSNNNVGSNQSPGLHNSPGPSMYRQQRFPLQHGQSEDSSHFYDQPKGFSRGRGDGHGYRGRRENRHNNYNRHSFHNMDRSYRMSWGYSNESNRVAPPAHSQPDERTSGPSPTTHPPAASEVAKPPRRPDSPASTVSSRHVPSKRHKSRSVSESGSSDRGSTAGSRSRSGSRSSVSHCSRSSVSSGRSRSPPHHGSTNHFSRGGSGAVRFHQNNSYSRQRYRRSRVSNRPTDSRARHSSRSPAAASPSSSTSSSPSPHRKAVTVPAHSPSHSPSSSKSYSPSRGASTTSHHHHQHHRRPPNTAELHAAIKIRNLPVRSSDTSLKDGLYHAYKKHGKVAWVRVIGSGSDRYAIVCFKSQEYAAKAVQSSQDKQFFGCKIQVTPYYTGKGEESVGGTDEESRGPGEEESSFPTRTVLITSLDSSVTVSELTSVFDQYGEIVNIDIRKQGSSTHAVCEFLDIASSIRAKWGRHVFKSREARISFYRNPPSNALLLDGTAGVTEKQVTSQCCQYGAIRRVDMDPERYLALVQYEEISTAETAIRHMRDWAIKGKKLDIDFASEEVIIRFLERLDPGLGNSLSICGSPISTPKTALNAVTLKDGPVRKARSRLGEYLGDDDGLKPNYAYRSDLDVDSKPMTTLKSMDESIPPNLNPGKVLNASRESHESLNNLLEVHGYNRRLESATDSQRSTMTCTKPNGKDRADKVSGSNAKIDLNCHETDSAIVTSSSDIIAVENSDNDAHSNFTGSSASGDEKVGSFQPAVKHRKSSSENISSVLTTSTTVDGVSSTSPEPKTEIVSTSADPGLGIGTDLVATYLNDAVATDSQKRLVDNKIRRTSADSGNHLNSSPECHALHSNQEVGKESPPAPPPQIAKRTESVKPVGRVPSGTEGEGDDRPGTPLCDENPEGFEGPNNNTAQSQKAASSPVTDPPSSKSSCTDPTNLPSVPSTPKPQIQCTKEVKCSNTGSIGNAVSPQTPKKVASPNISPCSGASSSVMLSSTNDTSIFSPNNESLEAPVYSKSSTNNSESLNTSNKSSVASEGPGKRESSTIDIGNNEKSGSGIAVTSDGDGNKVDQELCGDVKEKCERADQDEFASGAGFSSDSESGLSPRHSPTADSLEQRVKNLCERYDTWDGNRKILKHTPPVSHSPIHALLNQDSGSSSSKDSLIDKIKQTIPQFSGTSLIGRSVLARKSIFDEDCERLVNFNEKYETKPSTLLTASTNWKLPTLSRSTSCSSSSATPFLGQTSPLAVNNNCVPPLSSPINSLSPIGGCSSFSSSATTSLSSSTLSTKPTTIVPLCSTSPGYSSASSLSSAIVGKSVSEKVKDLNANVTPQLSRSLSSTPSLSLGQSATKSGSASSPGIVKPLTSSSSIGVPLPTSSPLASTKSYSSSQSSPSAYPNIKVTNDLTSPSPYLIPSKTESPASIKKAQPVHPLQIPNTLTTPIPGLHHSAVSGNPNISSPIPGSSVPRSVERSLSVESRKSSPGVSTPGFQQAGFSSSSSGSSSYSSESFGSNESVRPLTPRRVSVDTLSNSGSSSVSTDSVSSKQSIQLPATNNEKVAEPSVKSEHSRLHGSTSGSANKSSESKLNSAVETTHHFPAHQQHSSSTKEKVQTKEVLSSSSGGSSNKSMSTSSSQSTTSSKKNELSSLKDEISSKVPPVHQETTVAVVATVQTQLLTSRNEVINTPKDSSSKKDKDKKRRASGTSTPVSSGGGSGGSGSHGHSHHHQSGSSSVKSESHSSGQGTSSSKSSSSSKDKEERKDRKESKSSSSSSNTAESGNKEDSHHSHSSHHKKEKKDKDHRENSGDRSSFSNISKESHSHKRDKDNKDSTKTKRRLSSQENDQDRKKVKVEKDGGQHESSSGHHHHRSKSTSENKESKDTTKDSSSSTKEKLSSRDRSEKESSSSSSKPEKTSSSNSSGGGSHSGTHSGGSSGNPTGTKDQSSVLSSSQSKDGSDGRKEKSEGKDRDHHHKSKSSSSSSSTSKHHSHHHHQGQSKSSRSTLETHSSSGSTHKPEKESSSSSSKDPHKKEKEKSGKENSSSSSKSLSKHHSHTSHSSSSSKSKEKDSTSSSSKNRSTSSSSRKDKEKPKQERPLSSMDSDDDNDARNQSSAMIELSERMKLERLEKRDGEIKRERHKSGGGDSGVGGGDSEKSKRKKEPKKRRRVVEDSPSTDTDDEEEEKKHHSIFDVVIDYNDYYVSMYDKVKRSNRACKNVTAQQKQQEEEQKKKQDKVADSLKQLKQSRAKREEKKRSTSVEERKSMSNTSSDESHIEGMDDFEELRKKHLDRQLEKGLSSEDDDLDRMKSSSSSMKSKSKRKMKNKSSRKDDEKSNRKKVKRSNKSPSRSNMYSSSTLFSHSDDDSPASSSHPPDQKKKKLSSGSLSRHQMSSLGSSNNISFSGSIKSSDESHSESENISDRKKLSTSSSLSSKSKSFVSFSDQVPNHHIKYNSQTIYSDSDSSDLDQTPQQQQQQQQQGTAIHKTPTSSTAHSSSTSHRSKNKDKMVKQKRKQPLFDSTDSSDNEVPPAHPPNIHREKKSSSKDKESTKSSSKSKDRDKENKNRRKHRTHKSSSLKSRKQYYTSGDASGDGTGHGNEKRDAVGGTATMEELFGPMTSSSDSDDLIKESDHERPKTPTVVLTTPSSCEDSASTKKSSKSRHHHDKSPFSLRTDSHSIDEPSESGSLHTTPHQSVSSSSVSKEKSSEKKKKKHHKDKRSKRVSTHEGTPVSSQSSLSKQDSTSSSKPKQESLDYDSLFNSPAPSPSPELKIVESDYSSNSNTVASSVTMTCKAPSVSPVGSALERDHIPEIAVRAPTPKLPPARKPTTDKEMDECEKEMRGMFSSDEDEDDEKLKITDAITDAIRASADEQDIDSSPTKEIDTEWNRKEEEEKKLNILVEQDKAIESIVLFDRKTPTPQSSTTEEEVVKEEVPKDSTTISQEETDVAVATILETLGNEEDEEEIAGPAIRDEKSLIVVGPAVPPSLQSPPMLRIIEDAPQKPVETSESNDEIESAIAAIVPRDSADSNSEKEDSKIEPDPWASDDNRSPKDLQIDEGDMEETKEEEEIVEPSVTQVKSEKSEDRFVKSPEKAPTQPASFDEVSVDASDSKSKTEEIAIKVEPEHESALPAKTSPFTKEKSPGSKAGDIYEFHDSDDDKRSEKSHLSHTRHTSPMVSPPAKSPVMPPVSVNVPLPEPKLQSPPLSIPMPVLQPQQPPPPTVAHVENDKSSRSVLQPVPVIPPSAPASVVPSPPMTSPPVTGSPTIPSSKPAQSFPPLSIPSSLGTATALPPPPPPISSVPSTPVTVAGLQRSPPLPVASVIASTPSMLSTSSNVSVPPPPPIVSKSTPPPVVVTKVPPPPVVSKSTPPPPPVVSKSTPPPPPVVSKSTPPPLPVVSKSTPPPPPAVMATKSSIDDAIDSVLRKLHNGDPLEFGDMSPLPSLPAPPAPIKSEPGQRAVRRSRSRSKDSPDENASVPRVVPKGEPQRQATGQVLGVIGGHQMDSQNTFNKGNKQTMHTDMDANKTSKPKETLIEAQPGLLPSPVIKTEDGRYVTMIAQNDVSLRLPQPGMHQMPQVPLPTRQTPVISRMPEREMPTRQPPPPIVEQKHSTPLLPHQQNQMPKQQHEGLTAVLAQQQQQQQQLAAQQHLAHQQQQQQLAAHHRQQELAAQQRQQEQMTHQFVAHHQQQMHQRKPTEPAPYGFQPQSGPSRPPMSIASQHQQSPQPISAASVGVNIIRPVSTAYGITSPVHHGKMTTVVASSGNSASPTGVPPTGHPSQFMPGVHPPPVSRGVFVSRANSPGVSYPPHQQQQIIQLANAKSQERQSPRPSSRHTPGPPQTVVISQSGKPELIHLPELPVATTVTKLNAGDEHQRKSGMVHTLPNNVVLTSSGPVIPGTGQGPFVIKAVVSSPNAIQMTPQQIHHQRTLQEAFRQGAEGRIRLGPNKDEAELGPRPAEIMGLPQPHRLEIHGGSMQPPAHSPKPGRVPLPHEPLPTAHSGQPRGIVHRPAYETPGADLRLLPGHSRLGSDAPHYIPNQPEHPPTFSPHYIPQNHPLGHQAVPGYGLRHEKLGIPMDPKIPTSDPKGPAIITVVDRPPSHTVPPHLSSPHGNDQRGADSPSVGAVFPGHGQRSIYPSAGLPQQQHPTSQAISNMYAELDGRPYAHSPNFVYDSRAITVAAAAAAAMEHERERPKGTASPLEPYRNRNSPPPHSLSSGEAGLQGDSLLQLLQRYPIMWQGILALKNDSAAVQMHFVSGSMSVARDSLPSQPDGSIPPLRISQRMRLEQNQLEGVARKLQVNEEHCMLLALPCGRDHMDVLHQSNNLRTGFITYLQLKQAAGIVNICQDGSQQPSYVIHIFPSHDFANENLAKIAPDLLSGVADIAHLLIVIATV